MCFKAVSSHLAVGVRIEQGRLHAGGGLGGVQDHVVHILLHRIRMGLVLRHLDPLLTWLQVSDSETFDHLL